MKTKKHCSQNSRAVYTDVSGGPLGAGAGIYFGNLAEDQSIPLGNNVTVFQAETYAIQQCFSTLKSISVTGDNYLLRQPKYIKSSRQPQNCLKTGLGMRSGP